MISNNSGFNQEDSFNSEANVPNIEAEQTSGKSDAFSMMKDFGRKGLGPIVDVISKYKVDINPYISSVNKGLRSAVDSLNQESASESDRVVGKWFSEASTWINTAGERLKSSNSKDLLNFLEEEARNRPGVMFSASYVAGLFFGRVGRHVGSHVTSSPKEFQDSPNIH